MSGSRELPGVGLLLIGSGLYWLLSSQLISSFTVLSPGLFQSIPSGNVLITIVGIISLAGGLWIVNIDIDEISRLLAGEKAWIFVTPIAFASLDIYSTLINLSANAGTAELNPFVASAIQYGFAAMVPFVVSYFALSQGLALLMLRTGHWLFTESRASRFLPFALVCSASSFGPFSNLFGMGLGYDNMIVYMLAAATSAVLSAVVFSVLRNSTMLRMSVHT